MIEFKLDQKLREDCIILGKLEDHYLLLMNNNLVPWFILVPRADVHEFYEINKDMQVSLLEHINSLSAFIKDHFQAEKLNIATIGNIVKQLHIHIIGRRQDDFCWPGVVWGTQDKQPYSKEQINHIKDLLVEKFNKEFTFTSITNSNT